MRRIGALEDDRIDLLVYEDNQVGSMLSLSFYKLKKVVVPRVRPASCSGYMIVEVSVAFFVLVLLPMRWELR